MKTLTIMMMMMMMMMLMMRATVVRTAMIRTMLATGEECLDCN